jgi:hypothetical protein
MASTPRQGSQGHLALGTDVPQQTAGDYHRRESHQQSVDQRGGCLRYVAPQHHHGNRCRREQDRGHNGCAHQSVLGSRRPLAKS